MGHRSRHGDPVQLPGEHVRRCGRAGDVRRPSRLERRVEAVVATRGEVDEPAAPTGDGDARRFRGDERLVVDGVEEERFDELCLDAGSRHAEDRLFGEGDLALEHGPDIAREAEGLEPLEEVVPEGSQALEVREVVGFEAEGLEVIQDVFEAGHDEEVPVARELTDEELERGRVVHARGEVARRHGEFVQVDEESAVRCQGHSIRMPAARIASKARSSSPAWRFTARTPSRKTMVWNPSLAASSAVSLTQ